MAGLTVMVKSAILVSTNGGKTNRKVNSSMVETCLANTGQNMYGILIISGLAVACAIIWYLKGERSFVGFSAFALALMIGLSSAAPANVYAAEGCPPANAANQSTPDTSTGVKGATQTRNVLANDTPTPGSTFVLSSLRLGLVSGYVLGSTLSPDQKIVTAPTEGVYTAQNNGFIEYVPDANFVGIAKGVAYSIDDTAGNTTASTYKPIVTDTPPPIGCTATQLPGRIMYANGLQTTFTTPIGAYDYGFAGTDASANGQSVVAIQESDMSILRSTNGGTSWSTLRAALPGTGYLGNIKISSSGSVIVFTDEDNGIMYSSNDAGATWSSHALPTPGQYGKMSLSGDGSTIYYGVQTSGSPLDFQLYKSTNGGLTWNAAASIPNRTVFDLDVSANGQIVSMVAVNISSYTTTYLERSTDGGLNFSESDLGLTSIQRISSSADGQTLAYTVQNEYLYRSTDGGGTWNPLTNAGSRYWSHVKLSADGQKVLALADNDQPRFSNDGGVSWSVASGVPSTLSWSDLFMTEDGVHMGVMKGDSPRLFTSADSGSSWAARMGDYGIDVTTIDLDTSTPGIQQTTSGVFTDGTLSVNWVATYDPNTDEFTLQFDSTPAPIINNLVITYGAEYANGCAGTPGEIMFANAGGSS